MRTGITVILITSINLILQGGDLDKFKNPAIEKPPISILGDPDTLRYSDDYNWPYPLPPGNAIMMVFKIPADCYLKGVNIPIYEWGGDESELTVSLHKLSYPYGADETQYAMESVGSSGWIGGYDMNSIGSMSISGIEYTNGGIEGICTSGTYVVDNARDPLMSDYFGSGPPNVPPQGLIWPDSSTGVTLSPATHGDFVNNGVKDHWINLSDFGSDVGVLNGTWIGILVQDTNTGGGTDTTKFFFADWNNQRYPWVLLTFNNNCNGPSGNGGWHIQRQLINFELAIDFPYHPLPPPSYICPLQTTLSTDERTACVVLHNSLNIERVNFWYSTNSTDWDSIPMQQVDSTENEVTWECMVPGQAPGTGVDWYIEYMDMEGRLGTTKTNFYTIFIPNKNKLFFYNAEDYGSFIRAYYLYNTGYEVDYWDGANWGPGSHELFSYYELIIEVTGSGPKVIINDYINEWIKTKGAGEGYILTGDEWLGTQTGWVDSAYAIGTFQHDILGIKKDYNDINLQQNDDQGGISRILPIKDHQISGDLYDFLEDSLQLNYDPNYELGFSNWLDGIDPAPGTQVAFYGVSGILDSSGVPTGNDTLPIGIHRELSNGSKVVFYAFDPLAVNTSPNYHWIGLYPEGALQSALFWVRGPEVLIDGSHTGIPESFRLHQNHPNPFNPITTIRYELPRSSHVRLSVFDILGREVAVLGDSEEGPGVREVQWNASTIPSGIYFIQMIAGDFRQVRKVMVLK